MLHMKYFTILQVGFGISLFNKTFNLLASRGLHLMQEPTFCLLHCLQYTKHITFLVA